MLYLAHHGIKGQKWGERRYQYKDGSLTPEGRKRYGFLGSTKAYIKRRQNNVGRFYKESKNLGDDKTRDQMTREERSIYDKADASYRRRQKEAGRQYRKDLKRGFDDKRARLSKGARDSADKVYNNLADKGESGVFGHAVRAAKYSVAAESAATVVGSLLIKQAVKNNPNLNVNSSELLKVARKNARRMAVNYARAESAVGTAAAIHRGIRKNDEKQYLSHINFMNTYLAHHGIKGQKWGERKYQYKDGSLTPEGRKRYGVFGLTKGKESKNLGGGKTHTTKSRLKTAAKVALGVGAAAAVGYGAYKINNASKRYNRAKAYANAADIALKLKDSHGQNAKEYAKFAEEARKAGNQVAARANAMSAHDSRIRSMRYRILTEFYPEKVSGLKNYGGKSDRIAYSFVEKLAKNRPVDWREVERLLDVD